MPKPYQRSRSLKRKKTPLPSGRDVIHYHKSKLAAFKCAVCKRPLLGLPRLSRTRHSKIPKSKKRTSRKYGGNLCHQCLKTLLKAQVSQTYMDSEGL
ncbi:MAG: 50S ribosomal protein L34e [Candidatus Hodarchaeota archaeon]